MPSIFPFARAAFLASLRLRASAWEDAPEAVGLTAARVTSTLATLNTAEGAVAAVEVQKTALAAAVATADEAVAAARVAAGEDVATIRAFARSQADPQAVYNLARVPAPRKPSPRPAPIAPTGVKATLQQDGAVKVNWDATVSGTSFRVQRSVEDAAGETSPFTDLPGDGTKPILDATLPIGTRRAYYQVRATRSRRTGPWSEPAMIRFVAGSGAEAGKLKIAA